MILQGNGKALIKLALLLVLTLVACTGGPAAPTLAPFAATPVVRPTQSPTAAPTSHSFAQEAVDPVSFFPSATSPSSSPTTMVTREGELLTTAPAGIAGVRPGQAQVYRLPSIGPAATLEWRPPPLQVPLSMHPDDHYWLSRPLPSDKRNYDLEWFPYGNDVLLPELYPYRVHRGLDFPNPTGTPIHAASSGTVIHAGPLLSRIDGVNYYGNTVIIHHDWQWRGQDVYTLYAHTLELFVKEGDYVDQGQLIAGVGRSGIVSGPHLHLEVRIGENSYEATRNPMLWLAPFEGWGTIAGRFVDKLGKYIYAGWVSIRPLDRPGPARSQYTYRIREVNPDDIWRENFVFGDVPAGHYEVTLKAAGYTYRHTIDVLPGRTNFVDVPTSFVYTPPTPTPTPVITGTTSLTDTLQIVD